MVERFAAEQVTVPTQEKKLILGILGFLKDLRKLGNIRKIPNLVGDKTQYPVCFLEVKLWQ